MWAPTTESELVAALENGSLVETSSFEAKSALPAPGKNDDLAKSICAMTVDGGVILYGVGGEDKSRPTAPYPFPLANVAERIAQVAQTAIAEPPYIVITRIPTEADQDVGFISVMVPASPRAPHMLLLGSNRYYGRDATGNRILHEGEIARLYERRERWDVDREALLDATVAGLPFTFAIREVGAIAVVAAPVMPNRDLVGYAAGETPVPDFLAEWLSRVASAADPYPGFGLDGLARTAVQIDAKGADAWILGADRTPELLYQRRLELTSSGTATYWTSPVISRIEDQIGGRTTARQLVLEMGVTRAVQQLLSTVGELYKLAAFDGVVDVGVAVLGIERASGATLQHSFDHPVFGEHEYRRHARVTAGELVADTRAITRQLCDPLFRVISIRDYDAFADAGSH
jgi:hypothetical protein